MSGYEALREVLLTRGQEFGGRQRAPKDIRHMFRGRCVTPGDLSPYLLSVRKEVHGALKIYGSGLEKFDENIRYALEDLLQAFESRNRAPFDCYHDITDTLTSFICTLVDLINMHEFTCSVMTNSRSLE